MESTDLLPLIEYSTKYHVSISTLRRRIKLNQIDYQINHGKYLIKDLPLEKHHHPSLNDDGVENIKPIHYEFQTANLLLSELKQAYLTILREKEDQILRLKGQISDLETLVQALESENQRLR